MIKVNVLPSNSNHRYEGRTWHLILYSVNCWCSYQFSQHHSYISYMNGSENLHLNLRSERVLCNACSLSFARVLTVTVCVVTRFANTWLQTGILCLQTFLEYTKTFWLRGDSVLRTRKAHWSRNWGVDIRSSRSTIQNLCRQVLLNPVLNNRG